MIIAYSITTKPPKFNKKYSRACCFSFNGQERDNEIAGGGNINTAEYWEYDTRLGRRWNLDPKPTFGLSDYSCFGNNPIINIDILGDKFRPWDISNKNKIYSWNGYKSDAKYFADKSNLVKFNTTVLELVKSNQIFAKVYLQLYNSKTTYNVEQQYTFTPNYSRTTKTIGINYEGVGGAAEISKTGVFEEFFHAGQDEYYTNKGISWNNLAAEVEAKAADILLGQNDDSVEDQSKYNEIKSYFETGKKGKNFDKQVNSLINEVYDNYYQGEEWAKNNKKDKIDKKTLFPYLECLTIKSKKEDKKQ